MTPLILAVECGNELVSQLLQAEANIMLKDKEGLTALHFAAFLDNQKILCMLLDRGADFNTKDHAGVILRDYLSTQKVSTGSIL